MSLLEVKNVSKGFGPRGKRTEVLEDITLEVEPGEFLAIIGYSGAGKTTLMSLLAGLIKPDSGSIKLHGKAMEGPGPDRGIVFQNYSLLPWLTVYENIALAVDQVFCDWSPEQTPRAHRKANRHGEADAGARQNSARTLRRNASTRIRGARAVCCNPNSFCSMNRSALSMRSPAPICRTKSIGFARRRRRRSS